MTTSIDHMSTCAWSAPMIIVGAVAVSRTHSRWEGVAKGVQEASRTSRTASLTACPVAIGCSTHCPGVTSISSRSGCPSGPTEKPDRRVPWRATTASQAAESRCRATGAGRVKQIAIQEPGRSPALT